MVSRPFPEPKSVIRSMELDSSACQTLSMVYTYGARSLYKEQSNEAPPSKWYMILNL